jgi:hypothetical protein
MTEEKTYTQKEVDAIINNVRINERFMANQLMGDLGIPVEKRRAPDGTPIYKEAEKIVMNAILAPPKKQEDIPPY